MTTSNRDNNYYSLLQRSLQWMRLLTEWIPDYLLFRYLFATTYIQKSISSTGQTYHSVNHVSVEGY